MEFASTPNLEMASQSLMRGQRLSSGRDAIDNATIYVICNPHWGEEGLDDEQPEGNVTPTHGGKVVAARRLRRPPPQPIGPPSALLRYARRCLV